MTEGLSIACCTSPSDLEPVSCRVQYEIWNPTTPPKSVLPGLQASAKSNVLSGSLVPCDIIASMQCEELGL